MPRRTKAQIEKDERRSAQRHASHIRKTYGLEPEEYEAIKAAQGGVCAICQKANGNSKRLAIDHDHALEKAGVPIRETLRGLLCGPCNKEILGRLGDDPAALQRAIDYLLNPPARKVLGT